ncbi:hypothetical protein J0X19_19320 [Hymenobacter sp. BT186]|uniref:Uncharacterized protein n=1 Tax=Hymenobacter telluris TaxID=2816474 RepID=A0A939EZ10_9BACT|nr:hypothetical protein [Hymenobacter telluris]MBO0360120.1 hypothetical protein [Hymenobacter telluris]MBW3376147.1 hypothetical protein [Hymenobacter norwichensis]
MKAQKQKAFLKIFLGALGAVDLVWEEVYSDRTYGTVLYDMELKEQQAFVWHMTEQAVPSQEVSILLEYIVHQQLLDIDRLRRPLSEIAEEILALEKREKAVQDLFEVEVRMLDDGVETDSYFLHE